MTRTERAGVRPIQSAASVRSARHRRGRSGSIRSIASSGSILSIASTGSILSIASTGSILSIGSTGSLLSLGSVASVASVGSALSFGSVLSLLSIFGARQKFTRGALAGVLLAKVSAQVGNRRASAA